MPSSRTKVHLPFSQTSRNNGKQPVKRKSIDKCLGNVESSKLENEVLSTMAQTIAVCLI